MCARETHRLVRRVEEKQRVDAHNTHNAQNGHESNIAVFSGTYVNLM
jgi:hypothetical protein